MDMAGIASQFVDLVLKHKWSDVKELSAEEAQALFAIVSAAGFEPKEIVLGKLVGYYRDQDGKTGETYLINGLCPFKVVSQENDDHYFATGWLDCALRYVVSAIRKEKNRDYLIEMVMAEIERSVPLQPIRLTPDGDLLCESPSTPLALNCFEYFVEHTRDDCKLGCCGVSVHKYCNGWMDRTRATETHDAIVCRKCHLRVLFPKEIKTFGELRRVLAAQHAQFPVPV